MDGAEFVQGRSGDIDVVIVDSTDIIGFAKSLFSVEFFKAVKECLGDDGMFVTLSESLHFHREMVVEVQEALRLIFPTVDLYTASLSTYAGNWWTFSTASKTLSPREIRRDVRVKTRFYSEEIHRQAFLPPQLYRQLMEGTLDW
jgi:spermidine synthase